MNLLTISNKEKATTHELNEVIRFVQDRKGNESNEIAIEFQNPLLKIDIVFIAGLILLSHKHKIKFSIMYNGILPNSRIFEVRQYLKQFQNIYNENWTFSRFQGIQQLFESDYKASESFAPIIYIHNDTIDKLFIESNNKGEIFNLQQIYLNEKITGNNEKEIEYLNSEKSIKKTLSSQPPIYTFVFSILYNRISPFVSSFKKGITNPIQRTENLWEFTQEYVKGLHELAKNIVEHSETHEGMITIRVYDDTESKEEVNKDKVLETHVFDFGIKGMIPKLIEDTVKNSNSNKIYKEDLEILNGNFTMKDFIAPTVKTKLNQQLYRDIAHYGLMKFYKLIKRNNGIVVSSSIGKNGKQDIYYSDTSYDIKSIEAGTSYFFQLPFDYNLFQPIETKKIEDQIHGSAEIIQSLSELMNIKVINTLNEIPTDSKKTYQRWLWNVQLSLEIKNRDDENMLFGIFTELSLKHQVNYIAINVRKLSISDSSLLRLLAHLSTNYTQSIILYNLNFELYDEMIKNNILFFQTVDDLEGVIPFWYDNKGILIYTLAKGITFYFADILYGRNEQEFQYINYIVNNTFPNTLSIIKEQNLLIDKLVIPDSLKKIFFFQSALLPFDLLLSGENNKPLFQTNIETLLSQEMNTKKTE